MSSNEEGWDSEFEESDSEVDGPSSSSRHPVKIEKRSPSAPSAPPKTKQDPFMSTESDDDVLPSPWDVKSDDDLNNTLKRPQSVESASSKEAKRVKTETAEEEDDLPAGVRLTQGFVVPSDGRIDEKIRDYAGTWCDTHMVILENSLPELLGQFQDSDYVLGQNLHEIKPKFDFAEDTEDALDSTFMMTIPLGRFLGTVKSKAFQIDSEDDDPERNSFMLPDTETGLYLKLLKEELGKTRFISNVRGVTDIAARCLTKLVETINDPKALETALETGDVPKEGNVITYKLSEEVTAGIDRITFIVEPPIGWIPTKVEGLTSSQKSDIAGILQAQGRAGEIPPDWPTPDIEENMLFRF